MKLFALSFLALNLLSVDTVVAQAIDLNMRSVAIGGNGRTPICDEDSVLSLYNASIASFIFTNLRVEIDADVGREGRETEYGGCQMRTRMTIPQGYYLAGIQQVITGGAVKSRGARAFIRSSIFLRTAATPDAPLFPLGTGDQTTGLVSTAVINFAPAEEASGELLVADRTVTFGAARVQQGCQWTRRRSIDVDAVWRVIVGGSRTRKNQNIIIEADAVDTVFELGPQLRRCPR